MKYFTIRIDDQKYSQLHESEDSMKSVQDELFIVADGITRDPIGISDFSTVSIQDLAKAYPQPSPAKIAADKFVESVGGMYTNNKNTSIKDLFEVGNHEVHKLNYLKNVDPDYLENDYWACVGAIAIVKNSILHWGVIGDCFIKVYDSEGQLKFETPDSVKTFEKYFYSKGNILSKNFDWNKPPSRKLVRQEFRNNIEKLDKEGNIVSYGAITGEKFAMQFLYEGNFSLKSGDIVIISTDGFYDFLETSDFKNLLQSYSDKNFESYFKKLSIKLGEQNWKLYGRERSAFIVTV